MPVDPKDYEKNRAWYLARERTDAAKKKRSERGKARTAAIQSGALHGKSDPREVDHKTPLNKGGGNGKSNLQVISRKANRQKFDH